jgi:hypothetical protein
VLDAEVQQPGFFSDGTRSNGCKRLFRTRGVS